MCGETVYFSCANKNYYYYYLSQSIIEAFDVVWHASLLRKLFKMGITGKMWLTAQDMYKNMRGKVKWHGDTSRTFPVEQGLLQGGTVSPNFHKTYENPLLLTLQEKDIGLRVGSVYMGTITVADDKVILNKTKNGLQIGLNCATQYANRERYVNGPEKSEVVIMKNGKHEAGYDWKLNGHSLNVTEQYIHLGITRSSEKHSISKEAIQKARRTAYALMGAGLHGVNGLNPIVSYQLWKIYILPRVIYGLETIQIPSNQLEEIVKYERKFLKQIQNLPGNTANPVPYLLLGAIPVDKHIHMRRLGLLGDILRAKDSAQLQLAHRQLATKTLSADSWFQESARLLLNYGLPSIHTLMKDPSGKETWKRLVKQAVEGHFTQSLKEDSKVMKNMKYINTKNYRPGSPHPLWGTVLQNTRDVRRAAVKAKVVSGTYLLQANRAWFNQHQTSTCPLCSLEPEDYHHFILRCPALKEERDKYMAELGQVHSIEHQEDKWRYVCSNDEHLLQVILDASSLKWLIGECLPQKIEPISRRLIYSLHIKRSNLIAQVSINQPSKEEKRIKKKTKKKKK
jgi:hypothetical protein